MTHTVKEIRGIDYPYCERIKPAMFNGGYKRQRLISGRGRAKQAINVIYDDKYPADYINKILAELKACFPNDNDGNKAYVQYCSDNLSIATDSLVRGDSEFRADRIDNQFEIDILWNIKDIVSHYVARRGNTRDWTKANNLLDKLIEAFGDYLKANKSDQPTEATDEVPSDA